MSSQPDLDAYFHRIGYTGPRTDALDTLRALHKHHTQAIVFENLNPLLGLPVKLDPASLQQKLVQEKRGGYCFEQNLLFKHVLEALGFTVKGLAARVLWNRFEDEIPARGHMLLLVDIDGDNYIADVGFGALTLTGPLLLEPDKVQKTPHEPYRLINVNNSYILQALVRDEWKALYRFELQEQFLSDYQVTNWYLSNHPESHFVTGLIAARPDSDCRYALHDNEFKIHRLNGGTERRTLRSRDQIREILEDTFRLTLPESLELDIAFERLTTSEKVLT